MISIALPFLRVQGGGSVTVLSSAAGETPWPGHTIYNTAMGTLNMMVRCAALENANLKVRINAVAPGYVANSSRIKSERYLTSRSGQNRPWDEQPKAATVQLKRMQGPLTADLNS